jgi:hypothetical protein
MIKRLRPTHDEATLAEIYSKPYDSAQWVEHTNRVNWTVERLNTFLMLHEEVKHVADLSCGDGKILRGIERPVMKVFGDLVTASHLDVVGDINELITTVHTDLLICSETLEHLDDPTSFLERASEHATWICLTTPLGEEDGEKNYEHYWGWDLWGISGLLQSTGWRTSWVDTFNQPYYTYQLWIARSAWV